MTVKVFRRAFFAVVSVVYSTFYFLASIFLDGVEAFCLMCQAGKGDQENQFNFSLAFPDGEHDEFAMNGNPSKEAKPITLVMELDLKRNQVISARIIDCQWKSKWRLIEIGVHNSLRVIKTTRLILAETDRFLDISCTTMFCNSCCADTENRKKISPRKRVKSTSSHFQGYVSNIKNIMGFGQSEGIMFNPIEGAAGVSISEDARASEDREEEHSESATSANISSLESDVPPDTSKPTVCFTIQNA